MRSLIDRRFRGLRSACLITGFTLKENMTPPWKGCFRLSFSPPCVKDYRLFSWSGIQKISLCPALRLQTIFYPSWIKPSKNGSWTTKGSAPFFGFWDELLLTTSCCFFMPCVCVCVCTIRRLRFASLTFMYAFDVKQSKNLRHQRARGRNLGAVTRCWITDRLPSLIQVCTVA